jgi:hypothetical protein
VEVLEFETGDPAMRGEMTVTFTLSDADGGTDVLGVHENVPPRVPLPTTKPAGAWLSTDLLPMSKRKTLVVKGSRGLPPDTLSRPACPFAAGSVSSLFLLSPPRGL